MVDATGISDHRLWGVWRHIPWNEYQGRQLKGATQGSSSGQWFLGQNGRILVYDPFYDTQKLIEVVERMATSHAVKRF